MTTGQCIPQETLGALLTLHDVESVRDLENDLELSRRSGGHWSTDGGRGPRGEESHQRDRGAS